MYDAGSGPLPLSFTPADWINALLLFMGIVFASVAYLLLPKEQRKELLSRVSVIVGFISLTLALAVTFLPASILSVPMLIRALSTALVLGQCIYYGCASWQIRTISSLMDQEKPERLVQSSGIGLKAANDLIHESLERIQRFPLWRVTIFTVAVPLLVAGVQIILGTGP